MQTKKFKSLSSKVAAIGIISGIGAAIYATTAIAAPTPPPPPVDNSNPLPLGTELAGKTVFVDPGHQGVATPAQLNMKVPNGRGGTTNCQTMGATAYNGVPEHTINWNVSQDVKQLLEAQGAKVVMSRQNDKSWGGCVNQRAEAANNSGAQVAVSIHADGTSSKADLTKRGFHLIIPQLPIADPTVNQVQATKGLALSQDVRDAMVSAGFPISNYIKTNNGLSTRFDVAGPALTKIPLAFVEMGNLSNPNDANLLESKAGDEKYAQAIVNGITKFLTNSTSNAQTGAIPPSLPGGNGTTLNPTDPNGLVQKLLAKISNVANPVTGGTNPIAGTPLDSLSSALQGILSGGGASQTQTIPGATSPAPSATGQNPPALGGQTPPATGGNGLGLNQVLQTISSIPGTSNLLSAIQSGNTGSFGSILSQMNSFLPGMGGTPAVPAAPAIPAATPPPAPAKHQVRK